VQEDLRNIHNKALFDGFNEALIECKGDSMRAREKVTGWTRLFGGALENSELLKGYGIEGPLGLEVL
jgi:hypothetical protein